MPGGWASSRGALSPLGVSTDDARRCLTLILSSLLTYISHWLQYANVNAFAALADDTRRQIVDSLAKGEMTAGEIGSLFSLTQPGVSQHLRVLREAGLVRVRPQAQRRFYSVNPDGIRIIELWLERHRRAIAASLDALEGHMDDFPEATQ
jgi:DNA-binding transcriptional ArsR family regulator